MVTRENARLLDRLIQGGVHLLLAVSLLAFGGVSGWGRAAVVLLGACLLFCWACQMAAAGEIRWQRTPLDVAVAALAILFLIQLAVGFPWGWSAGVNPEAAVTRAMQQAGRLPVIPGTLDYHATREAFVQFLTYAGVFYLVVQSVRSRPQLDRLLTGLSALTAFAAFYGLVEFLSGNHGIFGWREYAPARVRGTLVNPDHFAAYLGMVIPVASAFLIGLGAGRRRRRRSRSAHDPDRHALQEGDSTHQSEGPSMSLFEHRQGDRLWERESRQLILAFGCAFSVVALVFTLSRGGIISFLAGSLFFVALLWIREPGYRRRLAMLGTALAAAALITWIGVEPVLERFGSLEKDSIVRGRLYRDVWAMARDFPILGSGLGTFGRVFPRYASPEFANQIRVSHAHSEPLQLAAEGGLVAVLILFLGLAVLMRDLLIRRLLGLLSPRASERDPGVQPSTSGVSPSPKSEIRNPKSVAVRHDPYNIAIGFGCLSSVVVIFLHSLFDFPLRIPANAVLLATVLGIAVVVVGTRFRAEGAETLLPTRILCLSRGGRAALVLGAGALALFMGWTSITGALAEDLSNRGYEIIAGVSGPEGRNEKPWVVETERNRQAQDDLRLAVRLDPLGADGQYRLGRLHEQLALRAWNAGLSREGRFISDLPGRASAALAVLDEAMAQYATAIRLAPTYAEAWGRLGWAFGIRGQIRSSVSGSARRSDDDGLAQTGLRQAIALDANNRYRHEVLAAFGFARLEAGLRASAAGRLLDDAIVTEGVRAQQRAVELDPRYLPEALERMLRYSQDPEALLATLPAQATDALFAARILEEQELWPQAKVLFQRAIELAPDDGKPFFYREYAAALTRRGEDAEARDVLGIVLRFDPQNLDLQLALAGSLQRLGQDAEALQVYQGALELAKALGRIARAPAAAPLRQVATRTWPSREERALEAIQERFPTPHRAADPVTRALGALAVFYHYQKRDDLAVPLWEKAMAATPDDAATAFGLARSYDAVGAWHSAVDYYKRAIDLNRGSLDYRLTLADRYYDNDMVFQAINLWREVVVVRPTLVEARLKLAAAYARLEEYPDAKREYERVLQLEPGNQPAKEALLRLRGRA